MTAEQATMKMLQNTEANSWDLLYNWILQGHVDAKTFREMMKNRVVKNPEKKNFVQDKYAINRELMKGDMESYQDSLTRNPGGGKKNRMK